MKLIKDKMKTILMAMVLMISLVSFAGSGSGRIIVSEDMSRMLHMSIQLTVSEDIEVNVEGVLEELGTVSLVNSNGETIYFEFLELGNSQILFETEKLKKGTYFVKIQANGEIRMKRVIITE